MKWVLLLIMFSDTSLLSSQSTVIKIAEPNEEACNLSGRKMTVAERKEITVRSGVWPDGKPWKVTKEEWTHPQFDQYSCVPGEIK